MCNHLKFDPCGRSGPIPSCKYIPSTKSKEVTKMTNLNKSKEVAFLKKLKSRFGTDIEFIGAMLEMLEEEMICQDTFMEMVKEITSGKGVKKQTTLSTGGCR